MPIPKPGDGESQDDFIGRCESALAKDFPDSKQRSAVCFNAWRDKHGGEPPAKNERVEFAVQVTGPARAEALMGHEYQVFPAVLVRSQVLHNNLGRTFLPESDITQEWADTANGAPVIIDHPEKRGSYVSARDPEVLNGRGAGFVYRARAENAEIRADVFIDPTRADAVPELGGILNRLANNEKTELSTGFAAMLEDVKGVSNGQEYDRILHPLGFDHLAIFADKRGACSVKDGCGLGVNEEQPQLELIPEPAANEAGDPTKETNMNRDEMIANLAARGPLAKEELEKLSDAGLQSLCAANQKPADEPQDVAILQRRNQELRRENDTLRETYEPVKRSLNEERLQMIEELIYNGHTRFSDSEIQAMSEPMVRNLYGTVFGRGSYAGRGGPRSQAAETVLGWKPQSVFDGKEAN